MPVKSERMLPMGILLIILGGLMTALHVGASLRGANVPMYFLVLGLSLMTSGIFFCLKLWAGVYVYLAGYGLALLTMLITEEGTQQLTPRLGGPILLGLFLINKMLKAKKAPDAEYAGQS
jgi:glucose dehydrogenase